MALRLFLVLTILLAWTSQARAADLEPFVTGLDLPVNMAFAPDGRLFVAEQHTGDIRIVRDGRLLPEPFAHLEVVDAFEQGLLGIALHPRFPDEPWVYVYYSDPALRINRLARIRADGNRGTTLEVLLDALTTERGYHNGGDLAFGADGTLLLTVGEVHEPERAQDPADIGGKVLRLNPDGSVPTDNPFGSSNPVYSIGHRNSFGICVDPANGDVWETENGPTSDDEVNRIEAGGNFGWPEQLGPGGNEAGFVDPVLDYPAEIVPTGCAVWNGDLYFGSYGDGILRRLRLPAGEGARDEGVADLEDGITDVTVGPDGALYVATSAGTILRLEGPDPSPTPTPPTATPDEAPAGAAPADENATSLRAWIALGAAVALGLGLSLRLAAGRRLRRDGGRRARS